MTGWFCYAKRDKREQRFSISFWLHEKKSSWNFSRALARSLAEQRNKKLIFHISRSDVVFIDFGDWHNGHKNLKVQSLCKHWTRLKTFQISAKYLFFFSPSKNKTMKGRKDILVTCNIPERLHNETHKSRNWRNEKWSICESPAVLTNPKAVNFMRQSWMGERRYVSLGPIMTGSVQLCYKNKEPNRENRLESQRFHFFFFFCCFLLNKNLSSSFLSGARQTYKKKRNEIPD